jgi:hypothetical protein
VILLYALIAGERPGALGVGVEDEPLELFPLGFATALIGEVEEPPVVTEATLRGWDAVVRRAAALAPALLPARFGEGATEREALRACFSDRREAVTKALSLVDGCEQMTLRVFGAPLEPQIPAAEIPPGTGAGTAYLLSRRAEERARATVPEIAVLSAELADLVKAVRVERHHGAGELFASVYHLVPRGSAEEYGARVASMTERLSPTRVSVSGPWPAYAFAAEAA